MTDPIVVPVEAERYVMVGDQRCPVSVDEWVASCLEPGERVWVEKVPIKGALDFSGPARGFVGVVRRSWFYDGVILDVWDLSDVDAPENVGVFCHRERIWPERGVVVDEVVEADEAPYTPVADWLAERRTR